VEPEMLTELLAVFPTRVSLESVTETLVPLQDEILEAFTETEPLETSQVSAIGK
jgi:hypothetical protein